MKTALIEGEHGNITIDRNVFADIAGVAIIEVQEEEKISKPKGNFTDGILDIVGIEKISKGVTVSINEESKVEVNCNIVVKYKINMPEICRKIQERVKQSIEAITETCVGRVDISVVGVEI